MMYEVNLWDELNGVCYMGDPTSSLDEAQEDFLSSWDHVYVNGDFGHIYPSLDMYEADDNGSFIGYP